MIGRKPKRNREEIRAHVLRRAGMTQAKIIRLAEKAQLNAGLKTARKLSVAGRKAYSAGSFFAGSGFPTSAGIALGTGTALRSAARQVEKDARKNYSRERIKRRLRQRV